MKSFTLIRHAKSSWEQHWLADRERPLNDRGLRDAPLMSKLFAQKHAKKPDLILCSPSVRTTDTAHYFAEAFGMDPETSIECRDNIYEAHASELYDMIKALPDDIDDILIIGHNPSLTNLANRFEGPFFDNIPTCGIVWIDARVDSWQDISDGNCHVSHFYFPKFHLK
jgi:phosphohistidine phosphatase